MDDEYLDAFVGESREAITELNNALLDLEDDPDDEAAMESIFRRAHTLKGNFGAMGFEDASRLAHAIEDVLDAMRSDDLAVTPEVMDLVFAGVDRIESIVDEIEAEGEAHTDPTATIEDLRSVLDGADGAGETDADDAGEAEADDGSGEDPDGEGGAGPDDAGEAAADDGTSAADVPLDPAAKEADSAAIDVDPDAVERGIVRAAVSVGDGEMPGVDAMLALEALEESFRVLETVPDREAVEGGEFEDGFVCYLDGDAGTVGAELDAIGKVAAGEARDVTDRVRSTGAASPSADGGASGSTDGDASASGDGGSGPADGGSATDHGVDEIKSVRVDVDRLDELHGQVEQLVTSRIKLRRAIERGDLDDAEEHVDELDKVTGPLQNTVMDMRLVPLKKVVGKFPRLVRDLARDLEKDVEFTIEGEDVELDRTILTQISDPLMHVLRNAVDHGIEPPAERERQGKPRTGHVELSAARERDHVIVEVADDGAGLDVDALERKAVEAGVRTPEELSSMTDAEVRDLIFHPGFSTAEEVTDTSGRGVGMDVVRETVTQLDGSVEVESTPGEGTTITLRLPVTMAILKVLFVAVGDEEYGVPLKHVDEITRTDGIRTVNGREVVGHGDDVYEVIDLGERFDVPGAGDGPDTSESAVASDGGSVDEGGDPVADEPDAAGGTGTDSGAAGATGRASGTGGPETAVAGSAGEGGMLVRIRESERPVALRCDAVQDQEEVVVKPLEGLLSDTPGLSGTAVLGDGNIVHIVDVMTI